MKPQKYSHIDFPYNLYQAVFKDKYEEIIKGRSKEDLIGSFYITIDNIKSMTRRFNYREIEVLQYRFIEKLTLQEIGKIYGVTKDRIRQIEAKALRKLMYTNEKEVCVMKYGMSNYIERIMEPYKDLIHRMANCKDVSTYSISIEDVELSTRAYNCLKRAGINTVKDLIEFKSKRGFERIRNLGKKTQREIESMLEEMMPYLIDGVLVKPSERDVHKELK